MPNKIWVSSIFSGLLLSLPWLLNVPGIILAVAFVPLLNVNAFFIKEKHYSLRSVFLYFLPAFIIWQMLSLWWVSKVTIVGAVFSVSFNGLIYTAIFWLAHVTGRKMGNSMGQIALLVFWIAYEYASLHVEFGFPWLILGNGLANVHRLVQWYEITGVLGGSAWLLFLNFLIYKAVFSYKNGQVFMFKIFTGLVLFVLLTMAGLSEILYKKTISGKEKINVGIIQPNIDPFTEKFTGLSQEEQLVTILQLADSVSGDSVDYFLAPETAIDNHIWQDALVNNICIFAISEFINTHNHSAFVIGAITNKEFKKDEELSVTARYDQQDTLFYDVFNSAIYIDTTQNIQLYHKSKLVLGVEKAPFLHLFKFLKRYTINIGGADGSFGQQKYPTVFKNTGSTVRIAPVICYESVFGEHIGDFIKAGANAIFLLTNDGWWGGTPGYRQHFDYARLRAIETRRSIARCANTGISGIIDSRGDIVKSTAWWKRTAISGSVYLNSQLTHYVKYGDFVGRIALFLTSCILMILITTILRKKQ